MAYRRKQGLSRASTFKEEVLHDHPPSSLDINNKDSSLASQAIKASAASRRNPSLSFDHQRSKSFDGYGDPAAVASGRGDPSNKSGFWGVLAHKAKSIMDDDNSSSTKKHDHRTAVPQTMKSRSFNTATGAYAPQGAPNYQYPESNNKKVENNPKFRKGLDAITTSLNQLGDTFEKAFEEGRTIVETKTADLRTQISRKGSNGFEDWNQSLDSKNPWQPQSAQPQNLSTPETRLKASRDVAMATAAKAKLLLRELKTVKADLAFAKARCAQLEDENKMLRDREGNDKGQQREDDDLIRLQLETLLAEKARLASENEVYARENRFLREVVEYHQLTMQDVVYLDEGMEEVSEVYPFDHHAAAANVEPITFLSFSPHSTSSLQSLSSPTSPDEVVLQSSKEMSPVPEEEQDSKSASEEDDGDGETLPSVSVSQIAK